MEDGGWKIVLKGMLVSPYGGLNLGAPALPGRDRFGHALAGVLHHKFQFLSVRNQAAFEGPAEKSPDAFTTAFAVIERPVIHIHSHKFIREVTAHVARVLQRVLHCFGPVIKTELDAGGENV